MKRYIVPIIIVILVLAAVAGALVLADKLFYVPDEEVISISDTVPGESIGQINVDIPVGYVNIFTKSSGENITLDFVGISDDFYKVEVTNDGRTLNVTGEEIRWYDQMRYSTADKYGVTIGIPEGYDGGIDIDTEVGNISLKDITALIIYVSVDVGNVSLSSVTVQEQVNVSLDTGNAVLNDVTVSTGVICEVDVGNIEFSGLTPADPAKGALFDLSCDVGSINGTLPLSRENYTLVASADLGKAPENFEAGPIKLDLSVDTGDITVGFGK